MGKLNSHIIYLTLKRACNNSDVFLKKFKSNI